ncbi:relaxase/mobilization nuclease domain-containing protein [Pseudomonas alliivorans]|nr:relaxase/mobilization nuclease domain-containing protein [Pseudomonas alliivorans]
MINGLSRWTTNAGKAIEYFLGEKYFDKELEEWKPRDPEPVILEGDPQAMKFICDKLEFKNKYTTGVLSFSPEETAKIAANPELKDKILQDFKDFAFAGVPDHARQFLAIEHTHTGRLEIHYMMPRVHLESGKYRNPFPPNYNGKRGKGNNEAFIKENDSYIDHACQKFGLTNPRDPEIVRDLKVSSFDRESATKKDVHSLVCELVESGHITCREDIQNLFIELGGTITRNGDDYLSVKFGDDQKAMRFKGDIYDKANFGAKAISESEVHGKTRASQGSIEQRFKDVMADRTAETQRRHNPQGSRNQEFAGRELETDEQLNECETEFSDLVAAHQEFENSTDDIPDVKSAAADFANSNRSQIAEYSEASSITSGVDVGDLSTIQTDDPVIQFFQTKFKQQLQRLMQQEMAASKRLWSTPAASKSDELLAERIGIIFKAAFGVSTGIDVDRPGAAFDRKALADSTAKASDLAQERAVVIEHDRQAAIAAAVAAAQEKTAEIEARQERDRKQQEERRLPSWKRNGHDRDGDDSGPRPGGR